MAVSGPDISRSALIVVDMQNDFLKSKSNAVAAVDRQMEKPIDREFLQSTIPVVRNLAGAFREAGRPVIFVAHVLKPDYSDAAIPFWRRPSPPGPRTFIVEGLPGSQIVDELTPKLGEHVVIKKGYSGFHNTPLETILNNFGVTTCVVCGVTTSVCVASTVRSGVNRNFRMIVTSDGVAEINREMHEAELKILAWTFADVKTSDKILEMLKLIKGQGKI